MGVRLIKCLAIVREWLLFAANIVKITTSCFSESYKSFCFLRLMWSIVGNKPKQGTGKWHSYECLLLIPCHVKLRVRLRLFALLQLLF